MERIVTFDDGASTVLESWGSTGPNIVCVHGITSSRKSWTRLATRFELACRVYAYDQRGHGDAAKVRGPMTLERSLCDLAEVVHTIGEPVDALVGHSWGGAVVLLGGLAGLAARVVAVDPMVHQVLPWREDFVDDVAADLALDRAEREREFMRRYAAWGELEIAGKIHAMAQMSIEPIERLGSENRADEGGWDLRARIAGYPAPLLLQLAGRDSVVTDDDKRLLEDTLDRNARIVTFEEDGHNLHRTNFERFCNDLDAFFATS
jgi:pimeloyl-ACP methyl ester carboxylesterase